MKTESASTICIYAALGFLLGAPLSGGAATLRSQLPAINFAYSAIAGAQSVPWVTKEMGLFEKYGLDLTMIYVDGGTKAVQAVLAGDVPIAQIGGTAPLAARLKGGKILATATLVNSLAFSLIVQPDIRRPEDLKGKILAVGRYGTIADYATRKILNKWGLQPDRDVAILQIPGGSPVRLAAVQKGQVAGTVGQPPLITLARNSNLRILAEPENFGTAYPNTLITVHEDFLKSQRFLLRRFKMAIIEGIHGYKTRPAFTKKVIAKYMRISDPQAIDDSYHFFSKLFRSKPYPELDGIAEALTELAHTEPKARSAYPGAFIDSNEIRELDDSGFIDSVNFSPK